MTSKEKVYKALNFKKTNSVPKFVWYSNEVKNIMGDQMGLHGPELEIELGNDILQTWLSINGEMEREVPENTKFKDEWGITWKRQGPHNMVMDHPLKDADINQIKNYSLPDPYKPERYKMLESLIGDYGDNYFIGADISGTIFEPSYHLMGMENLFMEMASYNEKVDVLFDKIMEFSLKVALESIKRGVDWIWLGDDLGTQTGMLMSPKIWRYFLKPRMKRIIEQLRQKNKDIFIAYHSCGSVVDIIPDLIEIGVNVLNPIQPLASGMDIYEIKEKFGHKLTLMGNIETQHFLKNATSGQIHKRIKEMVEELSVNGGYIFAASHTIQPDTPVENILALIDELKRI